MTSNPDIQTIIIGAGVIGLAIARQLSQYGHEVIVIEAEDRFGHHTSGRNSQVIHAGMYYPPGSLRAKLCVSGRNMLYDYCQTRHIDFLQTEKLIVATEPDQLKKLNNIYQRGMTNGVSDLQMLSSHEAMALEPELYCHGGAIHSPSTGIIDAAALMNALSGEAESEGTAIVYLTTVNRISIGDNIFKVSIVDKEQTSISCRNPIN